MLSNKMLPKFLVYFLVLYAYGSLYILVQLNFPVEKALFLCSISFLFICLLLEILFPFRKDWLFYKDKQSWNDIFLYLFNTLIIVKANSLLQLIKMKLNIHFSIWPAEIPFIFQVLLAFLVFDFFYYLFHRLSHTLYFLWMFHAVHHSSNTMHLLKSNRSNLFFDAVPYLFLTIFPLAFLSPPKEVVVIMGYTLGIFSFLTHCNIKLDFPVWWEYFFVSPKIHYMHHLKTPENLIGYNFSTVTLFWDKLFGTYRHYHQPENMEVGIEKNPVHASVFWQIFYPFKR
jgi:sterol desaturase/sphingolipid hydroxylase (fatty acid hydroxylase superfamily)